MFTGDATMDKIRRLITGLNKYTEYQVTDIEDMDSKAPMEKQLKNLEAMYFCVCSLRNTISGAIDRLQLVLQLKNSAFPEEWADEIVYSSEALLYENGIVVINIPEDLPKYSRELNLSCKRRWQGYIYCALKRLKAETGLIPYYHNVIVAIEVHSPAGALESLKWDTSNRTYNLILNVLKGLMFPDDNARHLIFTVSGVFDEQRFTRVYIGDYESHLKDIFQNLCKTEPSKL